MLNKLQHKYGLFFNLTKKLFFVYLVLLSVFMLFRTYILFNFGDLSELKNFKLNILKAFYVGGKFDTSVIAYGLLPVLIASLFFALFSKKNNQKQNILFSKITRFYFVLISMLFLILAIIDYFFYKFFQTHISPVIFGIKDDKTSAVIDSIWTDYPVIKIVILLLVMLFVFIKTYKKIVTTKQEQFFTFSKFNSIAVLLILGLYFVGMRGTLKGKTIEIKDTSVSTNTFVNELVLNGPFAIKIANSLNNEYQTFDTDANTTLKKYNFKNTNEVLTSYLGNTDNASFKDSRFVRTKKNIYLEENPPNVVFVLVEGLGRHYFDLHTKETNLLGDLELELPHLYYFKNMLSARNGTIETLESILVGTPKSSIAQSPYFIINYTSSVANPFKEVGYQTTYITGDNLGWRNTGKFIKSQNFDNVLGLNFLKKKFVNPASFTWGVHDEYLYNHIFDVLNNAKKPQFVFTLTISNHTPNDVPLTFKQKPIKLTEEVKEKNRTSLDYITKNFKSYQYAADALGKFIHKIRTSPLGKNTIIIATGDHNVRGMFNYNTDELFLKRSVPILMYIPDDYKPKTKVNLNRFGSHKDIFPTLFNLSLSNKKIVKTGNNLFSEHTKQTDFFAQNAHDLAGNHKGVVFIDGKTQYYKWKDTINFIGLQATTKEQSPELYKLKRKMDAHAAFTLLSIQQDISKIK